jgi:hypothetical protein
MLETSWFGAVLQGRIELTHTIREALTMKKHTSAIKIAMGITVAALIAAPLAGCSAASSALPSPADEVTRTGSPAARVDARKAQLLYVSDNQNDRILVYDAAARQQNPSPISTITDGIDQPYGITTDRSGNLYVANRGASSVTVYAPNSSTPTTTITGGLTNPIDVKVDGSGNVYVANNGSASGFIQEYPKGATQPSSTWTTPMTGMFITGIALLNPTQKGETSIYAMEYSGTSRLVGGILSCHPGDSVCTLLGYSFGLTGGIAVAESPGKNKPFEFLVVDDGASAVDTYISAELSGQLLIAGNSLASIALNSTENRLFVANASTGSVIEYGFPGDAVFNTFSPANANVFGVATYPAGTYH